MTLKRLNDNRLDPQSVRKRRKTIEGSVNISDLQRSMSCVIQAVENLSTDSDLIGDASRSACLPTVAGKHCDLKSISPEIVSSLVIIYMYKGSRVVDTKEGGRERKKIHVKS